MSAIVEQMIARGEMIQRKVAETGKMPDGMSDQRDQMAYTSYQRKLVSERGECQGGCDQTSLVPHHFHKSILVCPHTWEECPKRSLSGIVKQFGVIHDNSSSNKTTITIDRARGENARNRKA